MSKAVFFIYGSIRINLYKTLSLYYRQQGYDITFVVDNKFASDVFSSENAEILRYRIYNVLSNKIEDGEINSAAFTNSIDIDVDKYSMDHAKNIYSETFNILDSLNLNKSDIVFGGSGLHIQDLAIKQYKHRTYNTLFSEISNIPGKTFFDPLGANVISNFYNKEEIDPACAKRYSKVEFDKWREEQKKIKSSASFIPLQSKTSSMYSYISSTFKDLCFGYSSVAALKLLRFSPNLLYSFLKKKHNNRSSDNDLGEIEGNYLFHPLQVSTDTQLLYNSDYDNLSSIAYYRNMAIKLGLSLVVKYHPAETNQKLKSEIYSYCNENNITISKDNTIDLIVNSEMVGVNNSTVGLEAILLNKKVTFIGKTFYRKLTNKNWLYYYLFDYLVDIDFFSGKSKSDIFNHLQRLSNQR